MTIEEQPETPVYAPPTRAVVLADAKSAALAEIEAGNAAGVWGAFYSRATQNPELLSFFDGPEGMALTAHLRALGVTGDLDGLRVAIDDVT